MEIDNFLVVIFQFLNYNYIKEIKNLFNNIPENLKSDPDINKKVDLLLKNIYEMKKIIKSKKEEIKSSYKNIKSNNDIYKNNRPLSSW